MEVTKENEFDVVNFTNTTTTDFTGKWGGVEETIKAGETKAFPRFKSVHYANQLAKKILLGKAGEPFGDVGLREEMTAKMLGQVAAPVQEVVTAPEEPEFEEAPVEPAEPVVEPVKKKRGKKVK